MPPYLVEIDGAFSLMTFYEFYLQVKLVKTKYIYHQEELEVNALGFV
jgi:hypothetical protein